MPESGIVRMATPPGFVQAVGMAPFVNKLLKALGFVAAGLAVIVGLFAAFAFVQDRRMDSTRLVEQLDATPVPDMLVLTDSWNRDGDWLLKPRQPEAVRIYLAPMTPESACVEVERFYETAGLDLRRSSSSNDDITCIWRVGGDVSIWIEPLPSWTQIPPSLADAPNLARVRFSA